jgi:hypothetical protein
MSENKDLQEDFKATTEWRETVDDEQTDNPVSAYQPGSDAEKALLRKIDLHIIVSGVAYDKRR